jgi:hypothetical protein
MVFRSSPHWFWLYLKGSFTDDEWDASVQCLRGFISGCQAPAVSFIYLEDNVQAPNVLQRELLANAFKRINTATFAAEVIVTQSVIARGALTALRWLSGPQHAYKVMGDITAAWTFLSQHTTPQILSSLQADFTQHIKILPRSI